MDSREGPTKDFGVKIRQLRLGHELSQRDLARASGLTPSYISKIENGSLVSAPSNEAVVSLAKALETDDVDLLAKAGRVPSPFDAVARQPEATRFFRHAIAKIDTDEQWKQLSEALDSPQFDSERGPGR